MNHNFYKDVYLASHNQHIIQTDTYMRKQPKEKVIIDDIQGQSKVINLFVWKKTHGPKSSISFHCDKILVSQLGCSFMIQYFTDI